MLDDKKIGFIGAGALASALIKGLITAGTVRPEQILISDLDKVKIASLENTWNVIGLCKDRLIVEADVVILAVKPKDIATVLKEIGSNLRNGQILISVAAGIPTVFIEGLCAHGVEVLRVMPNTSATVLTSATAISRGKNASKHAEELGTQIFEAVGKVEKVQENLQDVITGLSGSGPAYVYYMVEAMQQAGAALGLPEKMARNLAVQTLFGAAKMLIETGENPQDLRTAVTSPGGTTFEGLRAMDGAGFHQAIFKAVVAATNRSKEMQLEFTGISGV